MQTRVEKKDLEFENVVGNLLIAEYQVERLRERVSQNLGLDSTNLGKTSESVFKCKNNWYRLTIRVDHVDLDCKNSK
jgi:hypothetical protein